MAFPSSPAILAQEGRLEQTEPSFKDTRSALAALNDCCAETVGANCSETAALYLENAYWNGEHSVLAKVMALAPRCDGSVREAVGSFLGDVLLKQTKTFLKNLDKQAPESQEEIALEAAFGDGSGLSDDASKAILAHLRRYLRNSTLQHAATLCRDAVLKAQEEEHAWEEKHNAPVVAPLIGKVVATACRINRISVLLSAPDKNRACVISLSAKTVIFGEEGGEYACENFTPIGVVVWIWPTTQWAGIDATESDKPIQALAIMVVRSR
jgi:hypothetical protein